MDIKLTSFKRIHRYNGRQADHRRDHKVLQRVLAQKESYRIAAHSDILGCFPHAADIYAQVFGSTSSSDGSSSSSSHGVLELLLSDGMACCQIESPELLDIVEKMRIHPEGRLTLIEINSQVVYLVNVETKLFIKLPLPFKLGDDVNNQDEGGDDGDGDVNEEDGGGDNLDDHHINNEDEGSDNGDVHDIDKGEGDDNSDDDSDQYEDIDDSDEYEDIDDSSDSDDDSGDEEENEEDEGGEEVYFDFLMFDELGDSAVAMYVVRGSTMAVFAFDAETGNVLHQSSASFHKWSFWIEPSTDSIVSSDNSFTVINCDGLISRYVIDCDPAAGFNFELRWQKKLPGCFVEGECEVLACGEQFILGKQGLDLVIFQLDTDTEHKIITMHAFFPAVSMYGTYIWQTLDVETGGLKTVFQHMDKERHSLLMDTEEDCATIYFTDTSWIDGVYPATTRSDIPILVVVTKDCYKCLNWSELLWVQDSNIMTLM